MCSDWPQDLRLVLPLLDVLVEPHSDCGVIRIVRSSSEPGVFDSVPLHGQPLDQSSDAGLFGHLLPVVLPHLRGLLADLLDESW